MSQIKYYGTETIHGHDGKPLPADAPIEVKLKGKLPRLDCNAGEIGKLGLRPQDAYPVSYTLRK